MYALNANQTNYSVFMELLSSDTQQQNLKWKCTPTIFLIAGGLIHVYLAHTLERLLIEREYT